MDPIQVNALCQKRIQSNTNGNKENEFKNQDLTNSNITQTENYVNNQFPNQENVFHENDQNDIAYLSTNQNYIFQNQKENIDSVKDENNMAARESNKDKEVKVNANAYPGDKPWNRAAKDPTLIQKGTELFVGNLSMDTIEEDLYESFQECGDIIDVRKDINFYIIK